MSAAVWGRLGGRRFGGRRFGGRRFGGRRLGGRLRRVLALLVGCGIWIGCDPGPEVPSTAERWIADADVELFALQRLRTEEEVRRWAVPELAALGSDTGLEVDLDTSGIDTFEVTIDPPPTFPILVWRFADPEKGRGSMHGVATGSAPGRFRFELGTHQLWKDRVVSLVLKPSSVDPAARFSDLRAIRWRLDGERLAPTVARPWKIDLGLEVREGWLAPPGTSRSWRPEGTPESLLPGGVLEVALGLERGSRERIVFRVTDGEGGATLLERRVGPADAGRWLTNQIDLTSWSGAALVFETEVESSAAVSSTAEGAPVTSETALSETALSETALSETATPGTIQLTRGFPVWGTARVVAPKRLATLPPNVLLISLDTLRADRLELYGHHRDTAPHLSAWAREHAVVFEQAIAPSPWTLPSHVSLFTGRDAISHGVYFDRPASGGLRTLAEGLGELGYATTAITGGGYLNPGFGLAQGFESFRYWSSASGEVESGSAHLFEALDGELPEPFFLFFHTYEVHSPFHARQPHFEALGGDPSDAEVVFDADGLPMASNPYFQQRKVLVRIDDDGTRSPLDAAGIEQLGIRYDSGISRVDALLAPLWEWLTSSELGQRTLVVITSDHGEALGEAGLGGHAYLYDYNLRVPLIVGLPGGEHGGRRVAEQVRLIDVAPTVLEVTGAAPFEGVEGASLLPLLSGDGTDFPSEAWSYAASSNYGASLRLANRSKIIVNDTALGPALGQAELYHLQDDPSESTDLLAQGRDDLAQLRRRVEARLIADAQGLELSWRAPEDSGLTAALRGRSVKAMKVKSWWDGCDRCYSWRQGGLRADIPAAGQARVVVLSPEPGDVLELTLATEDGMSWTGSLDLGEVDEGGALVFEGGDWVRRTGGHGSAEPATGPSLSWRWIGDRGDGENSAIPAHDPELARQLEALGYLDG